MKTIATAVMVMAGCLTFSQKEHPRVKNFLEFQDNKDWKINAASSIAVGLQTEKTYSFSLQGYAGFLKNKIEMRGDIFFFLGQEGDRPRFSMNHQMLTGAFWHFSEKSFQPYVGFQPGVAMTQSSEYGTLNEATNTIEYKITMNPIASGVLGFKLYAPRMFYMFAETRYVMGKHKSNTYPVHLDEWRTAFGLGIFL
jgi:hypothetical protein